MCYGVETATQPSTVSYATVHACKHVNADRAGLDVAAGSRLKGEEVSLNYNPKVG